MSLRYIRTILIWTSALIIESGVLVASNSASWRSASMSKGEHLCETPLASNQQLQVDDEAAGILTVRATVRILPQLRWWILGFGDCAEVLAPASLRPRELSQLVVRMGTRYEATAETVLSTPAVVTPEP